MPLPDTAKPRRVAVGLIGAGIALSRSPAMHKAEGAAQGLDYDYRLFDTAAGCRGQSLPALLDHAQAQGMDGLNITHPFKQAVIPLLDGLSETASAVGAVNTVVFRHGRRLGHNTDSSGFAAGFARDLTGAATTHVVQMGAGGAGCAVAHALLGLGVDRLSLCDPAPGAADALAAALTRRFGQGRAHVLADPVPALASASGLVNTTPVGMAAYPGTPVDMAALHSGLWLADIIYFPLETALIRAARQAGCRVMTGAAMAVFQAVRAFELFTTRPADAARMTRIFEHCDTPPG